MATEKLLQTRIKHKIDTLENWGKSNLVIKEGELCFATVAASAGTGLTEPVVMVKIGTSEEKTFAELPWSFYAKASDVLEAAKDATKLTAFINSVIADAGIATNDAMEAIAERVTKLEGDEETEGSVAKAIKDAIDALNLAETYVAIEEGKSLMTDAEHTKLAGISEGANKVEKSDTNGSVKVDGADVVVYTHPDKHAIADVEGLQDALDGKSDDDHKHVKADITDFDHTHIASEITDLDATIKAYDYATKDEAQGYADAKDEAIAAAKKASDDAAAALGTYKTEVSNTYETKTDAAQKLVDAKAYTDEKIAAIPAQTDYTVTITETTDGLASDVAKKYTFTQNGAEIGSINLAKELVVTSGSVKEVTEAGAPYAGAVIGDKYIELVIANQDAPIYVPAKDLVDIYTAKDGATEVQVAISNTNEISATIVNGGVTEAKLADDVKTKLNKTWEEVGVAKGLVDALADGQVKTNKEAIEAINNETTGILAQAKADAKSKADTAEQNAKDYADDQIEALALGTMSKETATDYVKKSEATGYDDILTKTEAEGAYQPKGDYATAEQGAKANTAIQSVTSVAGNGIKATTSGTSVTIDWDSDVTLVFDCGTASTVI